MDAKAGGGFAACEICAECMASSRPVSRLTVMKLEEAAAAPAAGATWPSRLPPSVARTLAAQLSSFAVIYDPPLRTGA